MRTDTPLSPALQRVQALHQAGHPQRAMAAILDKEGVAPPGRGKKWNQAAVRACLKQLAALTAPPAPAPPAPASVEQQGVVDAMQTQLQRLSEQTDELRRLLDRAAEQQGQQAATSAALVGTVQRWEKIWGTKWFAWAATEWRAAVPPMVLGVVGGLGVATALVVRAGGWEAVWSLFR